MAVPNREDKGRCTHTRGGHRDTLTDPPHHVPQWDTPDTDNYSIAITIHSAWALGRHPILQFYTKYHANIALTLSNRYAVPQWKKAFIPLNQEQKPWWIIYCFLPDICLYTAAMLDLACVYSMYTLRLSLLCAWEKHSGKQQDPGDH